MDGEIPDYDSLSGSAVAYIDANGVIRSAFPDDLVDSGTWSVRLGNYSYMVYGNSLCSIDDATADVPSSTSGGYCWCKATSYAQSRAIRIPAVDSKWVFLAGPLSSCDSSCSEACADAVADSIDTSFRQSIFENTIIDYTCSPIINLDWDLVGGSSASEPSSCIYGDILGISPINPPAKPGYTFNGWNVVNAQ